MVVDLSLEHLLVAAAPVVIDGADLDLDAMHVGVGVNDQSPDVVSDVQDYELRVLS
jgi:hypothetical protein